MANPLTRVKSVEQSMADTDEPGHQLRKNLTSWDLMVFGVSVVIGAGIFTITATTAGNKAGPAISLSFIMAAIACALAALCYAEFASTVPVAGSAYTFGYATFGEFLAWILGWDLILEFAVGASVVSKGWSSYLGSVFGFSGGTVDVGSVTIDWGAMIIVAVVTTLLVLGTKLSSRVSAVITAIKVAVVLLVIVVGFFYVKAANFSPFIPPGESGAGAEKSVDSSLFSLITGGGESSYGWYGVLAAASIVFFAFIGFDVVATTAEETRNPRRDVPRGILGSLAIVTVLYVLVTIVVTGMVSYTQLATSAGNGEPKNLATAFALNGVTWAEKTIAIGALAGLTTVVMVLMLGQSRVLFAMCRDGLLPRGLAKTHPRFGTPARLTLLIGLVVFIVAGFFPIDKLEEMVNVGTLFAFIVVAAGVMILRRTRPDLDRGFTVPGGPIIPVLAILACIWLMLNLSALTWIRFVIWMVIGVAVYFLYGMRHSMVGKRERGEVEGVDTVSAGAAASGGPDLSKE
ncbi:putative cationic amino acid transport membrane protein [Gordonia polyisoprenivorans VH2]|uniref:Amino acid permease n=2 Tax=Gordonia polyisoprenivorans TaxID=84595 RepID=A0A846WJT9_9ACTN|nr:amino acid permease [Gordonia polyisoprenivorans]AFA74513.1 putative cationic amino acid transport membrane protein [Gordonia polyisoprenivorans VH2]MBE7192648.1 amino acid permease [Gordonia polyisoprenivorans]NKY01952.1 amino acid permease [Gordonia polyisoprenivorans]OZC31525.1 amino acid permease [Gordonia polyisoprenivorans]QUD84100.1 amino acid permease [Gordonia polyisoprenivorans]